MDTSAGIQQATVKADFPTGVPVASDASMKDWMGYVYQQMPLPTNFTGVQVALNVLDSNGNYRTIGTATRFTYQSIQRLCFLWPALLLPPTRTSRNTPSAY